MASESLPAPFVPVVAGEQGKESPQRTSSTPQPAQAKTYNRTKLLVGIASSIISFVLVACIVVLGYSRTIQVFAEAATSNPYLALIIFSIGVGFIQSVVTLPLSFYSGYVIEHKYGLSNQTVARWAWERIKRMLVGLPLLIGILLVLYYCLKTYAGWWWLPVGSFLTLISVILARLAPVLIMPLFYKFTPLENGSLKERLLRLSTTAGLHVQNVFSFDMSKNTRKANAGFTGIGKSKRIILGDTLIKEFSEEEIETVFAHELGHYKHHHISVGIAVGIASTFIGLFATSLFHAMSISLLGFTSISELAALPLLGLWLGLYGLVTTPLGNILSRRHEYQADAYAVQTTGMKGAFKDALQKLAKMNLADPDPHPFIEWFLYSHPSIPRRLKAIEALRS